MAYAYGYSEPRDFFSVFSVSVVEFLENEVRFDINFTCKGRSRDWYILFYTVNSIHTYIAKDKPRKKKKNRKGKDAEKKKGKKFPRSDSNQRLS